MQYEKVWDEAINTITSPDHPLKNMNYTSQVDNSFNTVSSEVPPAFKQFVKQQTQRAASSNNNNSIISDGKIEGIQLFNRDLNSVRNRLGVIGGCEAAEPERSTMTALTTFHTSPPISASMATTLLNRANNAAIIAGRRLNSIARHLVESHAVQETPPETLNKVSDVIPVTKSKINKSSF